VEGSYSNFWQLEGLTPFAAHTALQAVLVDFPSIAVLPMDLKSPKSLSKIMTVAAKLIGAGLATIALGGVGAGIGSVFAGLLGAVARNPNEKDELTRLAILGFALTEAIALFALRRAFLLLFTF
jgi:F0F1-type ATP synthase membrane subunit c/vacuolar-type H+-ATPase subunit K